jgi:hypothetical protein
VRTPISFNNYEQGPDFERARTQIATPFQYLDISLDTAGQGKIFNVSGDFLYIDTAFDGVATIELNNQQDAPVAPFRVQQGFALNALFKQLKVSWDSQPGKRLRIMYSTGERVVPALTGTLNVTGTVSTIEQGASFSTSWKSVTPLAAGGVDTVFSGAANLNGAVLQDCAFYVQNPGANAQWAFLSKATAPTALTDGDMIASTCNMAANSSAGYQMGRILKPLIIPAGKGLYYYAQAAEGAGPVRWVNYTML